MFKLERLLSRTFPLFLPHHITTTHALKHHDPCTDLCTAQLAINRSPQIFHHDMYPSEFHDTAADYRPKIIFFTWVREGNTPTSGFFNHPKIHQIKG